MSAVTRSFRWRRIGLRVLPWVFALLLLAIALRAVPINELLATLSQLTWQQLLILTLVNSLIILMFSGRWWIILRALKWAVPYLSLSAYRLSAFWVSYFTPGTQFGGEPLQVMLLRNRDNVPGSVGAASVALDKAIELLGNFTFLAFGAVVIARFGLFSDRSGVLLQLLAVGLLLLPLLFLAAAWRGVRPLTWLLSRLPAGFTTRIRLLQKFTELTAGIEDQVVAFCQDHILALAAAMLVSLVTWLVLLTEYWLMLQFLGIDLDLLQTVAVLTIARFAFLIPLPGALGALEVSQVFALTALGYSSAQGLSLALLIRVRDLLFGVLGLLLGSALLGGRPSRDDYPDG
jgi:uncharacterized protein (TIRG00374 family)